MKIQKLTILSIAVTVTARDVYYFKDCPELEPKLTYAVDATNIHVDDINLIAGLGDSMMAGFLMDGYYSFFPSIFSVLVHGLMEYRGQSYTMGGDEDVDSIPNYLKVFNPNLVGYSVGKRKGEFCQGYCPDVKFNPETDVLNAALTGAMSINLDKEIDYLVGALNDTRYSTPNITNGWKMINFQIGYNDLCKYCDEGYKQYSIPKVFEQNIERAILRVKETIPKSILNIIEVLDISSLASLTKDQSYCFTRSFPDYKNKCPCLATSVGQDLASYISIEYNKIFKKLAAKYSAQPGGQFAVMYTPLNFNISTFKVEAFSKLDCFHLSKLGHAFHAKVSWRHMFARNRGNISLENFDEKAKVFCPGESDRFATRLSDLNL